MDTYVLLLLFGLDTNRRISVVPGYDSVQECKMAGEFWVKQRHGLLDTTRDFECIPGPRKP